MDKLPNWVQALMALAVGMTIILGFTAGLKFILSL